MVSTATTNNNIIVIQFNHNRMQTHAQHKHKQHKQAKMSTNKHNTPTDDNEKAAGSAGAIETSVMCLNVNINNVKTCKKGLDALKNMTVNGKLNIKKHKHNTQKKRTTGKPTLFLLIVVVSIVVSSFFHITLLKRKTKLFQEELERLVLL